MRGPDWKTMQKRFAAAATRFGVYIALAAALPATVYLALQPGPADGFRILRRIERPEDAAIRALAGPRSIAELRRPSPMPATVKGIYVSVDTAGNPKRFASLVELVDRTELNAMVIDVKDGRGALAFVPRSEALRPYAQAKPSLGELAAFTAPLREKGVYLIARIFVFQDPWLVDKRPDLAVKRTGGGIWRDRRGTPWLDPAADEVWKYNAAVAKEAFVGGFDEVQLDYVRFPSDGDLRTLSYPIHDGKKKKHEVMEAFFSFMDAELREKNGIPISVDLFGLTMWLHDTDLNIGQKLDVAARHFDAVSPMVYPSHYPAGFQGLKNPAAHPYEVIRDNMTKGGELLAALRQESERLRAENPSAAFRVATVRPWIQDFDLGADYTADMVKAQMRASMEGGASGWLVWNARNVYTAAAFAPEVDENAEE